MRQQEQKIYNPVGVQVWAMCLVLCISAVSASAGLTLYNTFDSLPDPITALNQLDADYAISSTTAGSFGEWDSLGVASGKPGFGLALDQTTGVGITYAASNLSLTQGTFEMWWKPSASAFVNGNKSYLFGTVDSSWRNAANGNATGAFSLYFHKVHDTYAVLQLLLTDASDYGQQGAGIALNISEGNWYHLAMTYSESACQIFFNGVGSGVLSYGIPFDFTAAAGNSFLAVGSELSNTTSSRGVIDSLGIYDSVQYSGSTYTVPTSQIPEPATLCLLGLGGIGMLVRRRRN